MWGDYPHGVFTSLNPESGAIRVAPAGMLVGKEANYKDRRDTRDELCVFRISSLQCNYPERADSMSIDAAGPLLGESLTRSSTSDSQRLPPDSG